MYYYYDKKIDFLEICISYQPTTTVIDFMLFMVCKGKDGKVVKVKIPNASKREWSIKDISKYLNLPVHIVDEIVLNLWDKKGE